MRDPNQELKDLEAKGLRRSLRVLSGPQDPEISIGPENLINFSSNDYLGLANDETLKQVYREAIDEFGSGSGASRLISGTMSPHIELEESIAALKKAPAALTFSSGFAAATGAIPAIVGKGDFVILDKLCHASLIDGARLSGATMRIFPHNHLEKLDSHLEWAMQKKTPDSRVLILTESVFSMDGDLAPLKEICRLREKYGALLMLDEAHALGVIGPRGRGLAAEWELESQVDFQMGTFSKAIGLSGGYLCATRDWIDVLINRARSFIYSTAPGPALAKTITASLGLVSGEIGEERRGKLWKHICTLDQGAGSAIIPIELGENERALEASRTLRKEGFLVPAIRYPTVPKGTARLRITLTATHRDSEVERIKRLFAQLKTTSLL